MRLITFLWILGLVASHIFRSWTNIWATLLHTQVSIHKIHRKYASSWLRLCLVSVILVILKTALVTVVMMTTCYCWCSPESILKWTQRLAVNRLLHRALPENAYRCYIERVCYVTMLYMWWVCVLCCGKFLGRGSFHFMCLLKSVFILI